MTAFSHWLSAPFISPERQRFHRQCVWVHGEQAQSEQQITAALDACPDSVRYRWLGDGPDGIATLPVSQYQRCLGSEYEVVVYNAFSGLYPNALLAIVGTITWGGRLILLTPSPAAWPTHDAYVDNTHLSFGYSRDGSRYVQMFVNTLATFEHFAVIVDTSAKLPLSRLTNNEVSHLAKQHLKSYFANKEQSDAFDRIQLAFANVQPCLLTGARGRGKSTLLALLIVAWLERGQDIDLVSQHKDSVNGLIAFCLQTGRVKQVARAKWQHVTSSAHLRWMAPDNAQLAVPSNTPLMVDEAAALPLPVLQRIIDKRRWFIFTSTTLGYEGSGRGLSLRIQPMISAARKCPPIELALQLPVRWHPADNLEEDINKLCFLKDTIEAAPQAALQWHTAETITSKEALEAMRLLDEAHYQSSPNDLKRLLDAPDVCWLLCHHQQQLVGAVLIIKEGGELLAPLQHEIAQGTRRVKGHMSAQMFSHYERNAQLATLQYWRVHRIAVKEGQRRQGIATRMLDQLHHQAVQQEVDILSTVYGETQALATFWQQQGYERVRIGEKKNKASGTFSALRLRWLKK